MANGERKLVNVAILTAVREERDAVKKRINSLHTIHFGGYVYTMGEIGGLAVCLIKSGMGMERSRHAVGNLLEFCKPERLLIAGFCAGIDACAATGAVVLPETVLNANGDELTPTLTCQQIDKHRVACGHLLSVDFMATTPDEKQALKSDFPDVVAVDMETHGAAVVANEAGIHWCAMRVVTDGPTDRMPLPFYQYETADGETNRLKVVTAALMHPWTIPSLIRFGSCARNAAGILSFSVECFVGSLTSRQQA